MATVDRVTELPKGLREDKDLGNGIIVGDRLYRDVSLMCTKYLDDNKYQVGECAKDSPEPELKSVFIDDATGDVYIPIKENDYAKIAKARNSFVSALDSLCKDKDFNIAHCRFLSGGVNALTPDELSSLAEDPKRQPEIYASMLKSKTPADVEDENLGLLVKAALFYLKNESSHRSLAWKTSRELLTDDRVSLKDRTDLVGEMIRLSSTGEMPNVKPQLAKLTEYAFSLIADPLEDADQWYNMMLRPLAPFGGSVLSEAPRESLMRDVVINSSVSGRARYKVALHLVSRGGDETEMNFLLAIIRSIARSRGTDGKTRLEASWMLKDDNLLADLARDRTTDVESRFGAATSVRYSGNQPLQQEMDGVLGQLLSDPLLPPELQHRFGAYACYRSNDLQLQQLARLALGAATLNIQGEGKRYSVAIDYKLCSQQLGQPWTAVILSVIRRPNFIESFRSQAAIDVHILSSSGAERSEALSILAGLAQNASDEGVRTRSAAFIFRHSGDSEERGRMLAVLEKERAYFEDLSYAKILFFNSADEKVQIGAAAVIIHIYSLDHLLGDITSWAGPADKKDRLTKIASEAQNALSSQNNTPPSSSLALASKLAVEIK